MNKRIKKKWARIATLENQVTHLVMDNSALKQAILGQQGILEEMQRINSRNVEATNKRFNTLEAENKSMRVDLDDAIIEFRKNKKKGLFGRR